MQDFSGSAASGSTHLAALIGWQRQAQGAVDDSFPTALLGDLAQRLGTTYAWLLLEGAEGHPELRAQFGFESTLVREPLHWPVPMPERHQVVLLTGEPSEPLAVLQAQGGLMIGLPGRRGLCGLGSPAARAFGEDEKMLLGGAVEVLDAVLTRDEGERLAAEALEQLRAALRATRLKLTQIRENERAQLARELHDDVVQTLIGISYSLAETRRALLRARENERAELIADLERQRQHVLEVARTLRLVVSGLRPAGIEEFGLVASLQNLLTQLRRSEPALTLYFAETAVPRLPLELELTLFRAAQEVLWSAIKRGQVEAIELGLRLQGHALCLGVEVAGHGVLSGEARRAVRADLSRIAEWLEPFGGVAELTGPEKDSYNVTVTVPMPG